MLHGNHMFAHSPSASVLCLPSLLSFAKLGDPYDDTVSFNRFCEVVNWFGPLQPFDEFFKKIKDVLSKPYFHGFVSIQKATHLVKNHFATSKSPCYIYRFSSTDLGAFVLTFIDKKGDISHKKIQYYMGLGYRLEEAQVDYPTFSKLHQACKQRFQLKKHVPHSPFQSLFM
jgi:hypothetical protein